MLQRRYKRTKTGVTRIQQLKLMHSVYENTRHRYTGDGDWCMMTAQLIYIPVLRQIRSKTNAVMVGLFNAKVRHSVKQCVLRKKYRT